MRQEFNAQQFYNSQINQLEKKYLENATNDELWEKFTLDLHKKAQLEITFDARFADTIRSYFKFIHDTYSSGQFFVPKLKWVNTLNNLAYDRHFISYRDFKKVRDQIEEISKCPSTAWLEKLPYLTNCENLIEFRVDFLVRFCQMAQEEAEALVEEIESGSIESLHQLKIIYKSFFEIFLSPNIIVKIASFVESVWSKWENKAEMLPTSLTVQIDKRLGFNEVGSTENEVQINKTLIEVAQNSLYHNDREIQQRLDSQVELIQNALNKFSGMNKIKEKQLVLHLGKFGSLISGFASVDADLDLTILTNSYVKEDQFLKMLHEFLKKEYQQGDRRSSGRKVLPQLILTAKTPLITIKISERGRKDINIDVIVNNILGVINSNFLRVYAGVRWVKNLGILVKLWGKSVGLIHKTALSSYAVILMLIHYLIKFKQVKPILDARNRTHDTPHFKFKRVKQGVIEQFDVFYTFKDKLEDVSTVERVNYSRILEGFFKYYATDIWKEKEAARIITVDQSLDKPIDNETTLTIKDPFDQPHNPGRLKIESKEFLVQKFKEAHEQLVRAKDSKISIDIRQDRIKNLFSGAY